MHFPILLETFLTLICFVYLLFTFHATQSNIEVGMKKQSSNDPGDASPERRSVEELHSLSLRILQHANLGSSISDFLRQITRILLDFTGCDVIGIYTADDLVNYYGEAARVREESFTFDVMKPGIEEGNGSSSNVDVSDPLIQKVLLGKMESSSRYMTKKGSFWIGNIKDIPDEFIATGQKPPGDKASPSTEYNSLALIPLMTAGENIGLLQMKSRQVDFFDEKDIEFYEGIAQTLGIALVNESTQAALRERVKELSCLYDIARISAQSDLGLDEILQGIAEILPQGWHYPEITHGRIIYDEHSYSTSDFQDEWQRQIGDILVKGEKRGVIEVAYSMEMPELDEGPFLKEERNLLDAISKQVARIIERRIAETDRLKLQDQLRHADRLATIGQLAAGVAHEFNEPLGNILGFAQLILKHEGLHDDVKSDIDKIVTASMHAREIVKKLMLFARQLPTDKSRLDLNQVIEEGLLFLETRCSNSGIELVRSLAPDLPEITANRAQMQQVLVNLIVNAIQAMPDGGRILIITKAIRNDISIVVKDTGIGMSDDVKKQLFIPFFTTKDIDEGTGLGLPVVHGIVTSHGGTIKVHSTVGKGSSFEIRIPVEGSENVEGNIYETAE
jgi:signal transduction histidine kinase